MGLFSEIGQSYESHFENDYRDLEPPFLGSVISSALSYPSTELRLTKQQFLRNN
ncbi:hypothetical protein MARINOS108_10212 [Marinoscillum sp. 108]|nr:hypothetical protein MARINOS108_10212 [Marinoscillum sp. 108]